MQKWHPIKKLYSFVNSFKKNIQTQKSVNNQNQGILIFAHTSEVIQAEQILKSHNLQVEIKGPPAQLQTGCDMVIVFDIILEPNIQTLLNEKKIQPLQIIALTQSNLLEPVNLYHVIDYGDWFMVRAANMKITVEKSSNKIVNISGGGCPDVPYLASRLLNQNILEVMPPNVDGKTLCSYSLQKAFEHAKYLLTNSKI